MVALFHVNDFQLIGLRVESAREQMSTMEAGAPIHIFLVPLRRMVVLCWVFCLLLGWRGHTTSKNTPMHT
mgnify:CR=1 FL=1